MIRIIAAVVGIIALLITTVLVVGSRLPVEHRASRAVTLTAQPEAVFALIAEVDEYPQWRTGVKRVEIVSLDAAGAPSAFRETSDDGVIHFAVVERAAPSRMVTQIMDTTLPFGGTWTFDVQPLASGSRLQITEDGKVYSPLFRFVSRYVIGHTRTLDKYIEDVSRKLP